jgi:protein-disulfide isomerase
MTQKVEDKLTPPVSERDHSRGSPTAPVTLVEYGDFECPYCGAAFYVIKKLEKTLGDKLRVVFRHFPLSTAHEHAEMAAEAAEAAGAQNKFWEMHDQLFQHQRALEREDLVRYAEQIDLDTARFVRDLTEQRFAERVREDFVSGVRSGVNGTPTFYINGLRYNGLYDEQSLLAAIREAVT